MKILLFLLLTCLAAGEQYYDTEVQAFGIFDTIVEKYIEPYVQSLRAALERIAEALNDKVENIKEIIDRESNEIEAIVREPIIRIINIANNIGADVHYIAGQIKKFAKKLVDNIFGIAKTEKEILVKVIEHVIDKIVTIAQVEDAVAEMSALVDQEPQSLIVDKILEKIVQPIVNRIQAVLVKIGEAIQTHAPNLKEKIDDQINQITDILKPVVVRAMEVLNDIGANVGALVQRLRTTVRNIILSLKGFSSETKDALLKVANHIINNLFGKNEEELNDVSSYEVLAENDLASYLILDKIYNRIIEPLLNRIKSAIEKIANAIERRAPNLKEYIDEQLNEVTAIMKPHVIRISNLLNDLGANVEGLVSMITERISSIIDNIVGVSQTTKDALIDLMKHFIRSLFDLVPKIEA